MTAQTACIFGCAGPRLSQEEAQFFHRAQPWGFILFARNLEDADQIRALTADLRAAVGHAAPIFIDQEGGRVQRMWPPLVRQWLPPLDDVARFGAAADDAMRLRYRIISAELLDLGIDGNCVPAVDVARPETHPIVRNRLLGDDPQTVARLGRVVADACLAGGVLPVVKHLPGYGRGKVDSHLSLPFTDADGAALESDFAPFRALADLPLGMTAHIVLSAIDGRAATMSPPVIDLIRTHIGFGGLLMTDDISMQALSGSVADRGRAVLDAGCDIVLHCNGDLDEMRAMTDAAGPMTDRAVDRGRAALNARIAAPAVDIDALAAEFETLVTAAGQ